MTLDLFPEIDFTLLDMDFLDMDTIVTDTDYLDSLLTCETGTLTDEKSTCEMGTQTDCYTDEICCVAGCRNGRKHGRRCRVHYKKEDVELKAGTPECTKCNEESYSNSYRYCRLHELEAGNLQADNGDFFARRVDYKTCVAKRCYRPPQNGWRCSLHERKGVYSFKTTVQTCLKCDQEVYGKGHVYCKLHQ